VRRSLTARSPTGFGPGDAADMGAAGVLDDADPRTIDAHVSAQLPSRPRFFASNIEKMSREMILEYRNISGGEIKL